MKNIKITVIIPVYNIECYLEKCLNSIVNQTYRELEIILINDGSTDNSAQICKKFKKQDSRIIYIDQENKGVSATRNIGIEKASGDWISFIDGDDYIEYDTYEKIIKYLDINQSYDFASYPCIEESARYRKQVSNNIEYDLYEGGKVLKSIFASDLISGFMWNKLFNTRLIKDNNLRLEEDIYFCEDLLFCYEYAKIATKMIYINQDFYHYVKRECSATSGKVDKRKMTSLKVYDYLLKDTYNHTEIYTDICNAYVMLLIYLTKRIFLFGCDSSDICTILKEQLMKYLPKIFLNKNLKFKYKIIGYFLIIFHYVHNINKKKDLCNQDE
jgi:Glycosyltransferases involved in cell wall biogenesis